MSQSEKTSIEGKVVRVELEGGFWGVIDSAGNRYVPIDPLERPFLGNGLSISADIELVTVFSATMWGKHARFHKIRSL